MRIVFPYWRGVPERCFYQDFHQGIVEALRQLGHETSHFFFDDRGPFPTAEVVNLYRHLERFKPDLVLDLACWGYGLTRIVVRARSGADAGVPILDGLGIPYAGWLFDQPCNQDIGSVIADACFALHPDQGHPDQMRILYPGLKLRGSIFAPPRGPPGKRSFGRVAVTGH